MGKLRESHSGGLIPTEVLLRLLKLTHPEQLVGTPDFPRSPVLPASPFLGEQPPFFGFDLMLRPNLSR